MRTTGRATTTRVTRRATATERFTSEAGRRSRPVLWILLGIGGAFAFAVLWMIFVPTDRPDADRAMLEEKTADARRSDSERNLPAALSKWKGALAFAEEKRTLRPNVRSIRAEVREVERRIADHASIAEQVRAFRVRVERRLEELPVLLSDGRRLLDAFRESRAPAVAELRALVEKLEKEDEERRKRERLETFLGMYEEIRERYGTDRKQGASWGPAIEEWRTFVRTERVKPECRSRAEREIAALEVRARDELESFRRRARAGRAEVAQEIRMAVPRFAGAECGEDFARLAAEVR
jgi:hypothetical protein